MGASVFFPTTTKPFKFIYFQCMSVYLMILIVDRLFETFREGLLKGS
jgi:hypothetical protein